MKYKRYIFLFSSAVIISLTVNSQSNFFIKVYGGYGLLTPGSYRPLISSTSTAPSSSHFEQESSMGKGLHYGGGLGISVNEFLNIGVDAEYLEGSKIKGQMLVTSSQSNFSGYNIHDRSVSHSVLSIIPNITFKALSKPNYYVYTRLGAIIAVKTKFHLSERDSSSSKTTNSNIMGYSFMSGNQSEDYTFKTQLGFQVTFGLQVNLSDHIKIFGELEGFFLPANPDTYSYNNTYYYDSYVIPTAPTPRFTYYKSTSNIKYFTSGQFTDAPSGSPSSTGSGKTAADPITTKNDGYGVKPSFNINYIGLNLGFALRF